MNPLDIDITSRTVASGIAAVGLGIFVIVAPSLGVDASMIATPPEILILGGFTVIYARMAAKKLEAGDE